MGPSLYPVSLDLLLYLCDEDSQIIHRNLSELSIIITFQVKHGGSVFRSSEILGEAGISVESLVRQSEKVNRGGNAAGMDS